MPACRHPTLPLPDFATARVVIVGDIMLDRYWHGATSRISPEAPVPIVRVDDSEDRVGGAGNVAMNIAALGGRTALLACVGADEAGRRLRELLRGHGCEAVLEEVEGHATITKLRVVSQHQQLIRLDFEQQPAALPATLLSARLDRLLADAGVLVLSDYAKGALADPQPLIRAARDRGIPVLVDPKRPDFAAYRGATLLTPNLQEFTHAVGECPDQAAIEQRGRGLLAALELEALLITRGEDGMTLLRRDAPALHLPTHAREVFDVTGAGDTVVALLAAALAAGEDLEQAAYLANTGAGIVVGKLGTATVARAELERELSVRDPSPRGVVGEAALLVRVGSARAQGESIVMTNGCFDILHPGHVDYLEQAAALGDRLVVAVNDDASVARLKGDGRPINPLAHRMAVLAGLRSVDWVVAFAEDTPERLICAVRPDLLVKGGDYRPDQIAGAGCVRQAGGEVRVVPLLEQHSTTGIIRKLRGA
ncbi:MAG: bifunctional D-glycero-beta-D-manno-heptose-7-phosphate kinase/D-glycero-beta-D-manno-heptose 1-phosphate adenylyltransferase HldE [Gammaproteobacteria bacterium]